LKFSPNKSQLCINYSRTENPNSRILITIQDEGPGIALGEHRRVFERFFTSSSPDTVSKSGSGLGLSIAKLIIDRIGGRIYFDEMIKGGAMCIIEIPLSNK
jgi:K+-sensing histidine kinase KdpD